MSTNGTPVVTREDVILSKLQDEDASHLVVTLTQASYDAIMEVVARATDRGLDSGFDHWFADAIKTGTVARLRTWNDRDVVTLYKQALAGNATAKQKLAKLLKVDGVGTNPSL